MPDSAVLEAADTGLITLREVPQTLETGRHSQIDALVASAMRESRSLDDVLSNVDKKLGVLRGDPSVDIAQLERDLDFVVNFLLLDRRALGQGEKPDDYAKEASARVQHLMSHRVFHASSPKASAEYIRTTYKAMRNTAVRIEQINRKTSSSLSNCFQGTRNQLAIERVLIGGGCVVFEPDYTQDPAEVDEEDNEVLQLDVKEGVDMVVGMPRIHPEAPRTILLLDAKGRNGEAGITEPKLTSVVRVKSPLTLPNKCLVRSIKAAAAQLGETDLSRVFRAKLFIPTEGRSFMPSNLATQEARDIPEMQQELINWGRLQPHVSDKALNELMSIEKY